MQVKSISYPSTDQLPAALQKESTTTWQFWETWLLVLAVVSIAFSVTMSIAPFMNGDEFMIVDLGRIILHPDTDWSITWLTDKNQPVFVWFYLGSLLQEFSFLTLGQYGPRISGLIGAFAAATAIVGWLMARGTSGNIAFLLGLVFLLDPLFVQAFTLGRVDGWTMALCILSCWILRDTAHTLPDGWYFRKRVMLAGALVAVAFFTWPSAVFLFPLILLELIDLVNKWRADKSWKEAVIPVFLFGIGGLIMGILLLLPIAPQLYAQLNNVIEGLATNTRAGETWGEQSGYLSKIAPFIELLRTLKFTPVLTLIALASIAVHRKIGLLVAALAATTLMLCTVVYFHRVQYLLPYFIAAVAGIPWRKYHNNSRPFTHLTSMAVLLVLLIWPAGLSLGIRSFLAFDEQEKRDRDLVYQAAQSMIGSGNHAVFVPSPEFYYPGRYLGWKMYRPYHAVGEPLTSEELQQLLPHVDYIIMNSLEVKEEFARQFIEAGMRDEGNYQLFDDLEEDDKPTHAKRLRNLYQIFRQPYGTYRLYVRETKYAGTERSH